jgi:hypothetical protein
LYVSQRIDPADSDVMDIVTYSRGRNAVLEVTGALVATPHHFAQILEGPVEAVDTLMASIIRDPRHSTITIAPSEFRVHRDFPRWALAYHGESSYVSNMIAAALDAPDFALPDHAREIRNLVAMLA